MKSIHPGSRNRPGHQLLGHAVCLNVSGSFGLAIGAAVLMCACPSTAALRAQTPAQTPSETSAPAVTAAVPSSPRDAQGLQRRPLELENTQPGVNEQYLIGAGDEVMVAVVGRPELSGTQTVGPDGRITLPVAGSVLIGEKSRDDAAKSVDETLEKFYSGPINSTVQVVKYGSNHILLLGAVEHPGVISFDQPPSLLEAITRGGQVVNPDNTKQSARRCIIYRGDNQVMTVNISEKFDGQRALSDIRLKRNDIVYIPEHQESVVSIMGEVPRPGPVPLLPTSTLVQLLSSAGGPTEKAGNNPTIVITEPSTGRIQQIKFKELLTVHGGTDVTLHDGDIVYVPRSGIAKMGYAFQQIAPLVGIGTIFTVAK